MSGRPRCDRRTQRYRTFRLNGSAEPVGNYLEPMRKYFGKTKPKAKPKPKKAAKPKKKAAAQKSKRPAKRKAAKKKTAKKKANRRRA
jgi:hypothetical protein